MKKLMMILSLGLIASGISAQYRYDEPSYYEVQLYNHSNSDIHVNLACGRQVVKSFTMKKNEKYKRPILLNCCLTGISVTAGRDRASYSPNRCQSHTFFIKRSYGGALSIMTERFFG